MGGEEDDPGVRRSRRHAAAVGIPFELGLRLARAFDPVDFAPAAFIDHAISVEIVAREELTRPHLRLRDSCRAVAVGVEIEKQLLHPGLFVALRGPSDSPVQHLDEVEPFVGIGVDLE